ncbi:MltA-interacting protein MipA [mine drainage metagenome]|jgi:outer membrane scaffolding protein for murein synthesis (MipA/OmpV family)|uniref:MltA-interacting protein MipA n=1 Tax=mine drainage metagenome TaxID=410659 RepID=A0A1J5R1P9_9ZZZZ
MASLMARVVRRTLAAGALLGTLVAPAQAAGKPLWELGLGVGAVSFPDYPGSSQQSSYVLPVPYFVYRGDFLRADKRGLRARMLQTDRVDANLSLGASPPVSSSSDRARSGMPDLLPTVSFGPAIELHLWHSSSDELRLDLRAPLRSVFDVERRPRQIGWLATPVLNLDVDGVAALHGWKLGVQSGPIFADRRYNRTYYGVDAAYAIPGRAAYAARGGYDGCQFTVALSRRFRRFWIGGFTRVDDLRGAVVADSPLVQRKNNVSAGIGIAWILDESTQTVDSDE